MAERISARQLAPSLDDDSCLVGRTVSRVKAQSLIETSVAQFCFRKVNPGAVVYLRDFPDMVRDDSGSQQPHYWVWQPMIPSRYAVVRILTLSGEDVVTSQYPQLRIRTLNSAVNELIEQDPKDTGAFPQGIGLHTKVIPISRNNERVYITQEGAVNDRVRILGISVQECPFPYLDVAADVVAGRTIMANTYNFASGGDIIDADYGELFQAVADLRKKHKKLLLYLGKYLSIPSTYYGTVTDFIDVVQGGTTPKVQFPFCTSPWLPETANPRVGVTAYVLAQVGNTIWAGETGTVRFDPASGSNIDVTIGTTAALYTNTGALNEGDGSASISFNAWVTSIVDGDPVDININGWLWMAALYENEESL